MFEKVANLKCKMHLACFHLLAFLRFVKIKNFDIVYYILTFLIAYLQLF